MNTSFFKAVRALLCAVQMVAFTAIIGVGINALPFAHAAYCTNNQPNCVTADGHTAPTYISTEYGRQLILAHSGPQAVAHMLHRINSLPPQPAHPSSFTTNVSQYSANWGGYVSDLSGTSNHVTMVQGTFNVTTTCGGNCAPISTWVGIGGYRGTNFVQAGMDSQMHELWYELVPQGPIYVGIYPSVGHVIEDEIIWDASTHKWLIYLDDESNGNYYMNEFAWTSDQSTADWIEEKAGANPLPTVVPMISFSPAYREDGDANVRAINNSLVNTVRKITLRASSGGCLVPSGLSSNGEGFTISRQSSC